MAIDLRQILSLENLKKKAQELFQPSYVSPIPQRQIIQQPQQRFMPNTQATFKSMAGNIGAGVERVKTSFKNDPLSYTPLSMREKAVPTFSTLGAGLGNIQLGQDVGYTARGALSLTPFQRGKATFEPTTQRQQSAQRIGKMAYGTALTAPIGGANIARNILSRAVQGSALGVGMNSVANIVSGNPIFSNVEGGAMSGLENSWQLAFTNVATDKLVGAIGLKGLTSAQTGSTFELLKNASKLGLANNVKKKLLIKGATTLLFRAIAETPVENTFFTATDKLSGTEKENFLKAWMNNLPGNLAGNLIFAGGDLAVRGTISWNSKQLEQAKEALLKTMKDQSGFARIPGKAVGDKGGVGKELEHARGTKAAVDLGGFNVVGKKNLSQAERTLQKAGELPAEIKTKKVTKDFIKNYYETKKPPVIGDIFINAKGERVEIIKIEENSVDYFLKGKKKGIFGTLYLDKQFQPPTPQPLKQGSLYDIPKKKIPLDIDESELIDMDNIPIKTDKDGLVTLYHRTSPQNAERIKKTGKFFTKENTNESYFSTKLDGQSSGYGEGVVTVKVKPSQVRLDDAFHKGDVSVAIKNNLLSKKSIIQPPTPQPLKAKFGKATKEGKTSLKLSQKELQTKTSEALRADQLQPTSSQKLSTFQSLNKVKVQGQQSLDNIISQGRKQIGEAQEKPGRGIKQSLNDLYTQWVDRYHPITQATQKVKGKLKTMKAELRPENDPTYLVRRLTGAGGIADARFKTQLNPLLKEMESLKIDKLDMDVYLANKRMAGFGEAGRKVYGADPVKAKEMISALETKYGEGIKGLANKLYKYQDNGFQEMVEAGFISPENAKIVKQQNPDYSPLYRVMDQVDDYLGLPTRKAMQGSQPIAKIKGSKRKIESPVESIIGNTFRQRAAIEKNRVANSIVGLQNILDIGFKKAAKSGEDTITIWKNGSKEYWQVGKDIADTAKGVNEESMNLVLKILKAPASLLRQGATGRNPEFMVPNVIRDQLDAGISSKYGYIPFVDYVSGLKSMLTNDKVYQRWASSGAKIDLGEMSGRKSVAKLFSEKTTRKGLFDWISKGLDVAGKYSEQPTRVGLFKKAYKKTGNELLSVMESRDATVDFARMGSKMKVANSIIPFLNVGVQGFDKLIRATKNNPGKVLLNSAIYAGIPAVATTIYNLTVHPEEYQEIPQYNKDSNFVLVKGRNENGTVDYLTFPKGNIVPVIANPLQSFLEFAYGNDQQSFKEMALNVLSDTLPVLGQGGSLAEIGIKTVGANLPQAIKPITENLLNKSFYKYDPKKEQTKDIVPSYLQKRPAYKQDYPFTPQMYKKIGAVFNTSPLKVKNLLEGYLAGYAKMPAQVVEMLYKSSRNEPISPNDKTLIRRFLKQTYPGSGQTAQFKPKAPGLMERITGKVGASEKAMTPEQEKYAIEDEKYRMRSQGITTSKVGTKYLVTKSNGDIGTIDVESVASLPADNGYQKAIKNKEAFKLVDDVLDNLPEEQQKEALGKLGIDKEEATYYNVARKDNDIKNAYIMDKIAEIAKTSKDRGKMLELISKNRLSVNGKQIASNGVIDDLYNMNLITYAEKKSLKALDFTKEGTQYKLKTTGRGKGAKIKKFTPIKPSKVKFVPMKVSKKAKFGISQEQLNKIKI